MELEDHPFPYWLFVLSISLFDFHIDIVQTNRLINYSLSIYTNKKSMQRLFNLLLKIEVSFVVGGFSFIQSNRAPLYFALKMAVFSYLLRKLLYSVEYISFITIIKEY